MAEPTLQDIFGAGATQDATTITLVKANFTSLTASANNRAESILAAIMLKALAALPQSTFDTNLDQSIYVALGFPGFAFRGANNDSYRVDQITVNLAKPDTASVIDPDDY